MATKKVNPEDFITYMNDAARRRQEFLKNHPVLDQRHSVEEYTPASEDDYGSWVPDRTVIVSPYFDTIEQAEEWANAHDPAPGTRFQFRTEYLREYIERRWTTY